MPKKNQTAPGRLEALRAFINTAEIENPEGDKLSDPVAAAKWLREHDLLPAAGSLDVDGLQDLIELRDAFRSEVLAHNGDGDSKAAWGELGRFAPGATLGVRLGEEPGDIQLLAQGPGSQLVTGRLFAIMHEAIRAGRWVRLKACRKRSCLWAFYDHSKNGSGSWCDMAICGNRLKAQRRRQRSATS